jgi:hypothetical protein
MSILTTTIAALGGGAVVALAVLKWTGNLTKDKLNLKWQKDYNREIEILKGEILTNQTLVNLALNTFSSGHGLSQDKRLSSIEEMWSKALEIRDLASPVLVFYSVLLPEEYNDFIKKDTFNVGPISNDHISDLIKETNNIEMNRPYLGEELWSHFHAYRTFMFRLVTKFTMGRENHSLEPWYQDKPLIDIVNTSLLKKDVQMLNFKEITALSDTINLLEQRMLFYIGKIITGEYTSESSFNHARNLMEIVNKTQNIEKKQKNLLKKPS